MFKYHNKNPLGLDEEDCVIRSISCATGKSWDYVYDYLSNLAQYNGTMMDNRRFVQWYLDSNYERVPYIPKKVWQVANEYSDYIVLCTMKNHICCIKYGIIYDTFDPSQRNVEEAWIVKD